MVNVGMSYDTSEFAVESIRQWWTVCHYPPGTSKWNKIEHCMFSFITMNWKGKPLISYVTIIKLISGTKTKKGG